MKIVTFDFDHTLKFETGEPNEEGVNRFRVLQDEAQVHVVTTRTPSKANQKEILSFLREHHLTAMSVAFTDGKDKLGFLRDLGSELHFDDDEIEIAQIKNAGIQAVNLFNPEKWKEHMESL